MFKTISKIFLAIMLAMALLIPSATAANHEINATTKTKSCSTWLIDIPPKRTLTVTTTANRNYKNFKSVATSRSFNSVTITNLTNGKKWHRYSPTSYVNGLDSAFQYKVTANWGYNGPCTVWYM